MNSVKQVLVLISLWVTLLMSLSVRAEESVCSKVKLEIPQELTLERQAFEATMKITNGAPADLTDVKIEIIFKDAAGELVTTTDKAAGDGLFFVRLLNEKQEAFLSGKPNSGTITNGTTTEIKWLIIPAVGAGGKDKNGKSYNVGARLTYKLQKQEQVVDVIPDSITVNAMPLLEIDYFLPKDVLGDEPLTRLVTEEIVPFSLGVRVKNSGHGDAIRLKINSAQPKIVENLQGLLVDFRLLGSQVDDRPVNDGLLLDFGTIKSTKSACGRWLMQSSLSGTLKEFSASYAHDDALGGRLTSVIKEVDTHTLLRDVRITGQGKDNVREFLALDKIEVKVEEIQTDGTKKEVSREVDVIRVYDSDGSRLDVTDVSKEAGFDGENITIPAMAGYYYAKFEITNNKNLVSKIISEARRSEVIEVGATPSQGDGRSHPLDNIWISKVRNKFDGTYKSFLNIFDYPDTDPITGKAKLKAQSYKITFTEPKLSPVPVIVAPKTQIVTLGNEAAFLVTATVPNRAIPVLTASPLNRGETFKEGIFKWTPQQTGIFPVTFTATAAGISTSQTVTIAVTDKPEVKVKAQFAETKLKVIENEEKIEIEVVLDKPCRNPATFEIKRVDNGSSASVVLDYLPFSPIVFAAGEMSKKFTITLNDDLIPEDSEKLMLELTVVDGAELAAVNTTAEITIDDDDLIGAWAVIQDNKVVKIKPDTGEVISILADNNYLRNPKGFVWKNDPTDNFRTKQLFVCGANNRLISFDFNGQKIYDLKACTASGNSRRIENLGTPEKLQIDDQNRLWLLSRFPSLPGQAETFKIFCLNSVRVSFSLQIIVDGVVTDKTYDVDGLDILHSFNLPANICDFQICEDQKIAVLSKTNLFFINEPEPSASFLLPEEAKPTHLALDDQGHIIAAGNGSAYTFSGQKFTSILSSPYLNEISALTWQQGFLLASSPAGLSRHNLSIPESTLLLNPIVSPKLTANMTLEEENEAIEAAKEKSKILASLCRGRQIAVTGHKPTFLTSLPGSPSATPNVTTIEVEAGDSITLRARADGTPSVTHQWSINDTLSATGPKLNLKSIPLDLNGAKVICTATNIYGSVEQEGSLIVYDYAPLSAVADKFEGTQGQDLTGNVLTNDIAEAATLSVETPPEHGQLTLNSDGSFTLKPSLGFYGNDSFTYKLERLGKTKTAPVSLSFAVQSLRAGGSLLINGFGGVNGLPLADIVIKKIRNGDISFDYETKSLHFHHNPIQDGPTGFAYAIKNSTGESSPVWVEIEVEPGDTFPPAKRLPQNWQKALGAQAAWMVEEFTLDVEAEVSRRLRSKNIGDNQSSGISYTGAFINGNISFSSKISSQVGDRLIFFIDGAPQSSITGIVDWKTLSFPVTAGIHTLTWYYQKDASGKAGEDSAWIDDLSLPLTADTLPSCSGLPAAWQTPAGMKEFKLTDLESKDGGCSLVSGNIGNKQASAMTLTADFQAGDLSFFSKVSSQLNADYLEFWLDDSLINTWSGKINWEQSSRTLTAGIHTLKFIYRKDAKLKADQDSAWIDNLILPQHDLRIFTLKASVESGMGTVDSKLWFSTDGQKLTLDYAPAADCKLAEAVMDGISLPIPEQSDLPGQLEIPALRKNSEVKLKFVKVNP